MLLLIKCTKHTFVRSVVRSFYFYYYSSDESSCYCSLFLHRRLYQSFKPIDSYLSFNNQQFSSVYIPFIQNHTQNGIYFDISYSLLCRSIWFYTCMALFLVLVSFAFFFFSFFLIDLSVIRTQFKHIFHVWF